MHTLALDFHLRFPGTEYHPQLTIHFERKIHTENHLKVKSPQTEVPKAVSMWLIRPKILMAGNN